MKGYSFVCSKAGFKTEYYPLVNMVDKAIKSLLARMESNGYNVELIKDWLWLTIILDNGGIMLFRYNGIWFIGQ